MTSYDRAYQTACELGNMFFDQDWWYGVSVERDENNNYFLLAYVSAFYPGWLPNTKGPYRVCIQKINGIAQYY